MVSVAVGRVTHEFGKNLRSAFDCVLVLFQDQHPGALAHHEPVPAVIPRSRSGPGIIIPGGKSAHGGEAGHRQRGHRRFTPARDHHVGVPALNYPEGLTYRMRAGGTRGGAGQVGSRRPIANRNLAGGQVGDGGGDEEG